ncbi:thymidine phosphorylase family protein [Patescibacteria group bacterium]|nr:thymidine phosphorylase family protein [Patescibacteria group bacterium]
MKLIPTKIPIKVGNKYIAVLNQRAAHNFDLQPGDRVQIKNGRKAGIQALLDVSENGDIKDHEIGLYSETWEKLKTKRGDRLSVSIAEKPICIQYIKDKLNGKRLSEKEINEIIKAVVADDLSDVEMAYFVSGCYISGLDDKETVYLTKSIVNNGNRLKFKKKIVVDKHCIGGVPGNRTTMIVIPIITALGLTMPKTSSRAITSPSGTADTMEVLANVKNNAKRLQQIGDKIGGFITWGGGVDLAAADDKMIRARHPLSLDPPGMLLASIMAKKHSVGANHVLIDIPMGPQVKVKNIKEAKHLAERFKKIAKMLGMKIEVLISNGDQPIGNGIGPVLECIDVMKVLKMETDAPKDLIKKSVKMAGILLELTKKARKGKGEKIALETLKSGAAYEQMIKIIKAQGDKKASLKPAKFTKKVLAKRNGKVRAINNKLIAHIARTAGAPLDAEAGVYLHKKLKDKVKKGEALYTIYADIKDRLKYTEQYDLNGAYTIK